MWNHYYDQVVMDDTSLSKGLARFECILDSLGVPVSLAHKNPMRDGIGLDEHADFIDYCHLSPIGARKLTHAVTTDLQARGILPLSDARPPALASKAMGNR